MHSLTDRMHALRTRLLTGYDGLGQSSGRPFLYFVYAPAEALNVQRLIEQELRDLPGLLALPIDVVQVTAQAIAGEEERRQALLIDPAVGPQAAQDMAGLWARALRRSMINALAPIALDARPVLLLDGLAALHPLTTPTAVMEQLAEQSIDHPHTGRAVPIVLFVPGVLLPHMSRMYHYMHEQSPMLAMYRGEDV